MNKIIKLITIIPLLTILNATEDINTTTVDTNKTIVDTNQSKNKIEKADSYNELKKEGSEFWESIKKYSSEKYENASEYVSEEFTEYKKNHPKSTWEEFKAWVEKESN